MFRGSFSHSPSAQFHGGLEAAPHAWHPVVVGLHVGEQAYVLVELFGARPDHDKLRPVTSGFERLRRLARTVELDRQTVLTTRQGKIDLREKRRVEKRTVERAVRVIDLVTLAQRVERIFLPRVQLARQLQRIDDRGAVPLYRRMSYPIQFQILELHVQKPRVDNQLPP